MSDETKAPTKAPTKEDVELDVAGLEGTINSSSFVEQIKDLDREALARMKAAALLGAQVPGLLRLAYIGEHHHPDLTWKARCEEETARADALQARVAELEWLLGTECAAHLQAVKSRDSAWSEREALRAKVEDLKGRLATEEAERIRCRDGWAKSALSAPPAETPRVIDYSGPRLDLINGAVSTPRSEYRGHSISAETPAPERQDPCKQFMQSGERGIHSCVRCGQSECEHRAPNGT